MFDFDRSAAQTTHWLETNPALDALVTHLPALELVTAHITKLEPSSVTFLAEALARVNASAYLEIVANETLAALILTNARFWQQTQHAQWESNAQRALERANRRWDDANAFFKTSATDDTNVFCTDANAYLGEAFFFAWRAFKDDTLRRKAGEILGHISALFDSNLGLSQRVELPDGAPNDTKQLSAYRAAMQMFLTACETTGRPTYATRACIVADYAVEHFDEMRGDAFEKFFFAGALARLGQFFPELEYAAFAQTLLETLDNPFADAR